MFSITTDKSVYKADDIANITLASAAHNLNVTVTIKKRNQDLKAQIIKLNNNKKTISIPITSDDIGGFSVNYSFAAFNSFQSGSLPIAVPYPKTDLEIETTTFRDKLQPGTDETWSFKIKGPQGDKVSAELLASMYDASLDQFKTHTWNFNPINNPTYYSYNNSNARQSFGTKNFRVYNDKSRSYYQYQNYDQLNWFGFNFGYGKTKYLARNSSMSKVEVQEEAMMAFENDAELESVVVMNDSTDKALVYSTKTEQSGGTIIAEITKKEDEEKVAFQPSMRFFKNNDPASILGADFVKRESN